MTLLVLDAGNSRTKWAIAPSAKAMQNTAFSALGVIPHAELAAWSVEPWKGCTGAVLSNVAGEAHARALISKLNEAGITHCDVLQATPSACGVQNGYAHAAQLGMDRWAAMIAAWQHTQSACLVVNLGTAITLDLLEPDGQGGAKHLGGMIMPGIGLMHDALLHRTAELEERSGWLEPQRKSFPTTTHEAINLGVETAALAAILWAYEQLMSHVASATCVLSGGDANLMAERLRNANRLDNNVHVYPHLVLEGLVAIESERACAG